MKNYNVDTSLNIKLLYYLKVFRMMDVNMERKIKMLVIQRDRYSSVVHKKINKIVSTWELFANL